MKPPKSFTDLRELSTEIHHLNSALALLHWDQETYMPAGGINPRSHQISILSTLIHEKKTSRKFKQCLQKLVHMPSGKPKVKGLSKIHLAMLREWHKDFNRAGKLPASFIETFSQVTSEASQIWAAAKKENNFKIFAPFLEKIIGLCRKKAEIYGFEDHPYDALLETYEPCMTTRKIDVIFGGLQKQLTALLKKITAAKQIDDRFLHRKVSDEKQLELANWLVANLPADPAYTRLDLSAHPFSTALHPHDSRITTRVLPNAFMSNLLSVLHEAGHSFYEMGLSTEYWGTPIGEATSLSIHESQSRLWETIIGRGLPFWTHFYPQMKKKLPLLKNIPLDKFYRSLNKVQPSLIRVEADEVTYCLHVIVRFEIEKALIEGKLSVADLPEAWNAKMKEYLGVTPTNDAQGCLQDIHWSLGDFGYFPTYALGNLFAAHFFSAFSKQHPDWEKKVEQGELAFIRDWLKVNIHQWGRMYNSEELAKRVTGKALSEKAYCSYLKKKYAKIYKF
ncbi:MAG: carboxypeptidase [Chlamydiae bacterium CG10_big_fil_rev_8_21_14_0_10_42_34]|nr:MAG: carboxypeptidase [Chlamydiae bacterium CG10_big_fil_rev_8_21_14_0_10_42_34]